MSLVGVALGILLPACGPITTNSILPPFRHPLLHRENAARFNSTDSIYLTETLPTTQRVESVCRISFSHPLLNRCETRYGSRTSPVALERVSCLDKENCAGAILNRRLSVAKRARSILAHSGGSGFRVGQKLFRQDCSGFVMAVYSAENLPLHRWLESVGHDRPNGVAALFQMVRRLGMVHRRKVPAIGDLVFFDNTYDRNRDGRMNDPLTHVGIVERVDADGTVSFIHHVRRGILRYKLNRFKPAIRRDSNSQKVLNHYLRVSPYRRLKGSRRRLTGELFHAFATLIS